MKTLKVSVIIPVYNEQEYIAACLDTVFDQKGAKFHEVIVVDNNSTDDTVQIAGKYAGVKILHEERQGQVFAQHQGFDEATGDIFARIDADTRLPEDWLVTLLRIFEEHPKIVAVTGTGKPYDVFKSKIGVAVFHFYHHHVSRFFAGHPMTWGSNMALRSEAWDKIRDEVYLRRDIWEDYDTAFCLAKIGKIRFDKRLKITCSFRAAYKPLRIQLPYQFRSVRTFYLSKGFIRAALFGMVWFSMGLLWWLPLLDRLLRFLHLRRRITAD